MSAALKLPPVESVDSDPRRDPEYLKIGEVIRGIKMMSPEVGITVAPDWLCEVLSPSTAQWDRTATGWMPPS